MVRSPGAMRSKPKKHRARDALGLADLRLTRRKAGRTSACLDAARHRGPWVRAFLFALTCVNLNAPGPLASRAPSVFRGCGGKEANRGPARGRHKNTGGEALAV